MKKSSRVDNYAYLVFGLAGVVFSILWLCDIVKFEMDDGSKSVFTEKQDR